MAGLREAIAGMVRPVGAGAIAGAASDVTGLGGTGIHALAGPVGPGAAPEPDHTPAVRDVAPQTTGDCHRLRMLLKGNLHLPD